MFRFIVLKEKVSGKNFFSPSFCSFCGLLNQLPNSRRMQTNALIASDKAMHSNLYIYVSGGGLSPVVMRVGGYLTT